MSYVATGGRSPRTMRSLGVVSEADVARELAAFMAELSRRGVQIVLKSGVWHQKAIDALLRVITLGQQTKFLTGFITTIGHTIYVPDDFDTLPARVRLEVLRHEAVHVGQFEHFGGPVMALMYLTVPFPVGLAWARAQLEWAGYAETLRTAARLDGIGEARSMREFVVKQFTSGNYAWMWPFPGQVGQWFDDEIANIERTMVAP